MIITMDMSSYEIEKDAMETEYGEEIISAGWNPAVDLVREQLQEVGIGEQMTAVSHATLNSPNDVSMVVAEIYLRKMYSYQH